MEFRNSVADKVKTGQWAGPPGGEADVRPAVREQLKEEIRIAIREYLAGSDARGEKLARMLEVSKQLSDKELAATARTEKAILFSDFVGSCALFNDLGDVAAHELIQEYFGISKVSIAKFTGEIIKYTGDGVLALFPNTVMALKASLFARSMFEIHNNKFPLLPVNVRMGVNVGEVIQDEVDAYGSSVNLSARICDASRPGGILCSNIVRLRNQDKGFRFVLHNDLFAKGFPVPIKTHFLQDRRSNLRSRQEAEADSLAGREI